MGSGEGIDSGNLVSERTLWMNNLLMEGACLGEEIIMRKNKTNGEELPAGGYIQDSS